MKRIFQKGIAKYFTKCTAAFLAFTLAVTPSAGVAQVIAPAPMPMVLPAPGTLVPPSDLYVPVLLKGMTIDPSDPLRFEFIVDNGHSHFNSNQIKDEAETLVRYFLASMTIPAGDLWVNLSPEEPDRIIPDSLSKTDLGRDLLAQDYLLKQLTASLMNPEDQLGAEFWERMRALAKEEYGTDDIPMETFNKVWIVPEKAIVYEHEGTVYIVNARLKVLTDLDYKSGQGLGDSAQGELLATKHNDLSPKVVRELILPEIEREVNYGKNFAQVRQIYHSLILAKWYKETVKDSLLARVYADKAMTGGIDSVDPKIKDDIYAQYMDAYKQGVFNYIREDYDRLTNTVIPRKYYSGGIPIGVAEIEALDVEVVSAATIRAAQEGENSRLIVGIEPTGADAELVKAELDQRIADPSILLGTSSVKRLGFDPNANPNALNAREDRNMSVIFNNSIAAKALRRNRNNAVLALAFSLAALSSSINLGVKYYRHEKRIEAVADINLSRLSDMASMSESEELNEDRLIKAIQRMSKSSVQRMDKRLEERKDELPEEVYAAIDHAINAVIVAKQKGEPDRNMSISRIDHVNMLTISSMATMLGFSTFGLIASMTGTESISFPVMGSIPVLMFATSYASQYGFALGRAQQQDNAISVNDDADGQDRQDRNMAASEEDLWADTDKARERAERLLEIMKTRDKEYDPNSDEIQAVFLGLTKMEVEFTRGFTLNRMYGFPSRHAWVVSRAAEIALETALPDKTWKDRNMAVGLESAIRHIMLSKEARRIQFVAFSLIAAGSVSLYFDFNAVASGLFAGGGALTGFNILSAMRGGKTITEYHKQRHIKDIEDAIRLLERRINSLHTIPLARIAQLLSDSEETEADAIDQVLREFRDTHGHEIERLRGEIRELRRERNQLKLDRNMSSDRAEGGASETAGGVIITLPNGRNLSAEVRPGDTVADILKREGIEIGQASGFVGTQRFFNPASATIKPGQRITFDGLSETMEYPQKGQQDRNMSVGEFGRLFEMDPSLASLQISLELISAIPPSQWVLAGLMMGATAGLSGWAAWKLYSRGEEEHAEDIAEQRPFVSVSAAVNDVVDILGRLHNDIGDQLSSDFGVSLSANIVRTRLEQVETKEDLLKRIEEDITRLKKTRSTTKLNSYAGGRTYRALLQLDAIASKLRFAIEQETKDRGAIGMTEAGLVDRAMATDKGGEDFSEVEADDSPNMDLVQAEMVKSFGKVTIERLADKPMWKRTRFILNRFATLMGNLNRGVLQAAFNHNQEDYNRFDDVLFDLHESMTRIFKGRPSFTKTTVFIDEREPISMTDNEPVDYLAETAAMEALYQEAQDIMRPYLREGNEVLAVIQALLRYLYEYVHGPDDAEFVSIDIQPGEVWDISAENYLLMQGEVDRDPYIIFTMNTLFGEESDKFALHLPGIASVYDWIDQDFSYDHPFTGHDLTIRNLDTGNLGQRMQLSIRRKLSNPERAGKVTLSFPSTALPVKRILTPSEIAALKEPEYPSGPHLVFEDHLSLAQRLSKEKREREAVEAFENYIKAIERASANDPKGSVDRAMAVEYLEKRIDQLRADMIRLKAENKGLEARVSALSDKDSGLKGTLRATIAANQSAIEAREADLNRLKSELVGTLNQLQDAAADRWTAPDRNMAAENEDLGGIDFNAIGIDRSGSGINVHYDPAVMDLFLNADINGFKPVILDVGPLPNLLPLLGFTDSDEAIQVSSLKNQRPSVNRIQKLVAIKEEEHF